MREQRFEINGFWLGRRAHSPKWCACWYDPAARSGRQVRRASLGTSDLQEAKIRLAQFVIERREMRHERPEDTPLEAVLVRYWNEHARKIASSVQADIALGLWSDFFAGALVSELGVKRQEAFIAWLREKGYSDGYVSRVLSVGRAALNRAVKRQDLDRAPFIMDVPDRAPAREKYRLSLEEVAALLTAAAARPHVLAFCMVSLNTLARPEAVLDLAPWQIDLANRRISLNPPGRRQTKKFRPVVPITDTLLPWVTCLARERVVMWKGKPVASIKTAFNKAVAEAGLPQDVCQYSLRHTMATELRRRGVSEWEVKGMLGHRGGVTETYAKYSPDYLGEAARAVDRYFTDLRGLVGTLSPEGLSLTGVRSSCVRVVAATKAQVPGNVVGAAGIEPATPTMST